MSNPYRELLVETMEHLRKKQESNRQPDDCEQNLATKRAFIVYGSARGYIEHRLGEIDQKGQHRIELKYDVHPELRHSVAHIRADWLADIADVIEQVCGVGDAQAIRAVVAGATPHEKENEMPTIPQQEKKFNTGDIVLLGAGTTPIKVTDVWRNQDGTVRYSLAGVAVLYDASLMKPYVAPARQPKRGEVWRNNSTSLPYLCTQSDLHTESSLRLFGLSSGVAFGGTGLFGPYSSLERWEFVAESVETFYRGAAK